MIADIPFSQSNEVGEPSGMEFVVGGQMALPFEPDQAEEVAQEAPETPKDDVQYLTRQELEAAIKTARAEFLEAARRQAQSFADQAVSRVDRKFADELNKLETSLDVLKKSGVPISDEQVRAARQELRERVYSEVPLASQPETPSENGKQAGSPETANVEAVYVQRTMARLNKTLGGELLPTDPEASGMDNLSDPDDFLAAYETNLRKKVARMRSPASARVASAVQGGASPTSSLQKAVTELNNLLAHPKPEDLPKMRALQETITKLRAEAR